MDRGRFCGCCLERKNAASKSCMLGVVVNSNKCLVIKPNLFDFNLELQVQGSFEVRECEVNQTKVGQIKNIALTTPVVSKSAFRHSANFQPSLKKTVRFHTSNTILHEIVSFSFLEVIHQTPKRLGFR